MGSRISNVAFLDVALVRRSSGIAFANLAHQESVLRMGWPNDELEVLMIETVFGTRDGVDKPESRGFEGVSFVEWPWDELEVILCDGNVLCEVFSVRGLSG